VEENKQHMTEHSKYIVYKIVARLVYIVYKIVARLV
jgi:hypothetical protein